MALIALCNIENGWTHSTIVVLLFGVAADVRFKLSGVFRAGGGWCGKKKCLVHVYKGIKGRRRMQPNLAYELCSVRIRYL